MARRVRLALVVVCTGIVSGCLDSPTQGMSPSGAEAARVVASLPGTVPGMIDVLFRGGNATAAQSRWNTVQRFIQRGELAKAQKQMFDLADFALKKQRQGQLLDPDAEGPATVQQGVTKLLSLMFNQAFPDAPPLPEVTHGDAIVTLVDGSAQTAVTPQKKAGIELPEGSTDASFILVIDQNPAQELYLERCSGPLPTTRCQFPLFYNFTPYPKTRLKKMARFGVCTIGNHGEARHPRGPRDHDQHERLRLAHPAHPERNNHPVVDGITIMPLVPVDFLDCEETTFPLPPSSANALVRGATYAANWLGSAVARTLTPKNLYAIDRGGGGEDDFFSPFNAVDTSEVADAADLDPTFLELVPAAGVPGEFVDVDATARNAGTAETGEFGYQLVWATNPELTANRQVLLGISTVSLPPGESQALFPTFGFFVPEGVNPGIYYVGVVMDHNNDVAESDETNNVMSVPFAVLPEADGNTFSLGARGTAITDGVLNAAEWSNAVCKSLSFNVPFGEPTPGKVCVMSDATSLYLAVSFRHHRQEPGNTLAFEFDNDGVPGSQFGDDIILFNPPNFVDDVVHLCESGEGQCKPRDTDVGGTNDGAGAFRHFSSTTVYELQHPLNSGDVRDFVRAPGEALAFRLFLRLIASGASFPSGFGDTDWPASFQELARIQLAP